MASGLASPAPRAFRDATFRPRTVRHRAAVIAAVVLALIGLSLSTVGSFSAYCNLAFDDHRGFDCSPWYFEPWWGFWTSVIGCGVLLVALIVRRRRWRRASLLVAALAACLAASPMPVEWLLSPTGTPILKG